MNLAEDWVTFKSEDRIMLWPVIDMPRHIAASPLYEPPEGEAPYGSWAGRAIIGRDSSIRNGVYLGFGEREALVVDDGKYPHEFERIYTKLLERLVRCARRGRVTELSICESVELIVQKEIAYDRRETQTMTAHLLEQARFRARGNEDLASDKVQLNYFLREKKGVCRHQALVGAYLLERLRDRGLVEGHVSVDRAYIRAPEEMGRHTWARYTTPQNEVIIIDVALRYVGRLGEGNPLLYERPPSIEQKGHPAG